LAGHARGFAILSEHHSSPDLSQFGTHLPHSILDTLLEFYFGSADNNEAINGYTELAFELVWLCVARSPVRREIEIVSPGVEKPGGQKGGAGRVASSIRL
jgi:hypothetical protein